MLASLTTPKEVQFNKALIRNRFLNAATTYRLNAIVQKEMAKALVKLAAQHICLSQKKMFEIGCGTGVLSREILRHFSTEQFRCNDLVDEVEACITRIKDEYAVNIFEFLRGDAEKISFPKEQNVIWSGATLQWIQQLDQFFFKLFGSIKDKGYLVLSSFGPDNYKEIKSTTGKGIKYKTVDEVLSHAHKYFEVLEKQEWHRTLWFKSPVEVLKHMRLTGVNGISSCKWTKGDLMRFKSDYQQYVRPNGYPLSYHPFLLVLKKR